DGDTVPVSAVDMLEQMGDAMSHALIAEGAKDWRSVGQQMFDDAGAPVLDADGATMFKPLPFSADNLGIALADPVTFEAFDNAYVVPFVMRERERADPGNVSAASPSGIGEAAMPEKDTASNPAESVRVAGARSARTSPTSRKPKPRKTSGVS
ncbi:MAG: hypothetical protein M3Y22_02790, partial [Pseudomonadota bacterium]|nr:hypothetical protein [Pseudomonadota bacterium]